jgi:hypothetical protein
MPPREPSTAPYGGFAATSAAEAAVIAYTAFYDRPTALDLLGDVRGRRVLDPACGPGLYLAAPGSRRQRHRHRPERQHDRPQTP